MKVNTKYGIIGYYVQLVENYVFCRMLGVHLRKSERTSLRISFVSNMQGSVVDYKSVYCENCMKLLKEAEVKQSDIEKFGRNVTMKVVA